MPLRISILPMSRDYMSQYAPEGNSVGVAISLPMIELKPLLTSILAMSRDYMSQYAPEGNSVGVAISRRHYHQCSEMEAIAIYRHSRTF